MGKVDIKPILLAPAGNWECLSAALQNGADAVYFGVGKWNMRCRANANFLPEDLCAVVEKCHSQGVQAWLTLNIIAYDEELSDVQFLLESAQDAGVDAVIAVDPAVICRAHSMGMTVHLSVQGNLSNWESIAFYSGYVDTVVAARELTLEQLSSLSENIRLHDLRGPGGELIRLEAFIHGALCIGLSGRCGMSLCEYNTSSNRGSCYQPCRREYIVRDAETGFEFKIQNRYIMSPKDLCTIAGLGRLLQAGVSVLKIEGRGRSADYVATTTRCYREALDCYLNNVTPTAVQLDEWKSRLRGVFNRQFWDGGYYYGEQSDVWAADRDSQATIRKEFVGVVIHYYARPKVVELILQSGNLKVGDKILFTGPTTGAVEYVVPSLQVLEKPTAFAAIGDDVTFPFPTKLRPNDKVYVLKKR